MNLPQNVLCKVVLALIAEREKEMGVETIREKFEDGHFDYERYERRRRSCAALGYMGTRDASALLHAYGYTYADAAREAMKYIEMDELLQDFDVAFAIFQSAQDFHFQEGDEHAPAQYSG